MRFWLYSFCSLVSVLCTCRGPSNKVVSPARSGEMIRALVCWLITAADFLRSELSDRRVVAERNGFLIAKESVDMALARAVVDGALEVVVDDVVLVSGVGATSPSGDVLPMVYDAEAKAVAVRRCGCVDWSRQRGRWIQNFLFRFSRRNLDPHVQRLGRRIRINLQRVHSAAEVERRTTDDGRPGTPGCVASVIVSG